MNTADNTTDEGVDVVDMLIQLLVRQVSALVAEAAHELAGDEATIYRVLRRTAQRRPRCSSS